ncbi:MAG: GNAT family N-acetyltransferase [Candidatus Aenigmarchaeota archaeon]|nr:GNAT family N-acetyltransferase [Candidatus Aenigmarchaeota archaeon]
MNNHLEVVIREAYEDDLEKIGELLKQIEYIWNGQTRNASSIRGVKKEIRNLVRSRGKNDGIALVAVYEGEVIGYIQAIIYRNRTPPETEVGRLVVDEPYRRQGIASQLYESLEKQLLEYMKERGTKKMKLYAIIDTHNEPSQKFFEKQSYSLEKVKERNGRYYKAEKWLRLS